MVIKLHHSLNKILRIKLMMWKSDIVFLYFQELQVR